MKNYLVFYIVVGSRGEVLYSGSTEYQTYAMRPDAVAAIVKEQVRDTRVNVDVYVTGMLDLDA